MFSQILIVMVVATMVTIVAHRRGAQPSLLLVVVGLAASFIPTLPRLELEPEIILSVVLPPLLFSAAIEFSYFSFRDRLRSILNLGVVLVVVTAAVVGLVASAIGPGMSIAVALILGAIVSPPDAVTAIAVGRKAGLPSKLMTVLKGESLINDAAALTLFSFATASVAGTQLFTTNLLVFFGYGATMGLAIGLVLAVGVHWTRSRLHNPTLSTVLSVLVPFTAFMLAEEIHASGVLAVVAAGFYLGHTSSDELPAARIQERQFWSTADALLETFVFAYIGLQLRFVIEDANSDGMFLLSLLSLSAIILAVVIGVRIGWIYVSALIAGIISKFSRTAHEQRKITDVFSSRENFIVGWTGMRGVVTLAAAAGLPLLTSDGLPFPERDAIQAVAFLVTIGTLLLQGLTLPFFIRVMGVEAGSDKRHAADQTASLLDLAHQAGIGAVAQFRAQQREPRGQAVADRLEHQMLGASQAMMSSSLAADIDRSLAEKVMAARRAAVIKARDERNADDETVRDVLRQFDLEQAAAAGWSTMRGSLAKED